MKRLAEILLSRVQPVQSPPLLESRVEVPVQAGAAVRQARGCHDVQTVEPDVLIQDRAELVQTLLGEAWGNGLTTYTQLIGYVREKTGTGCSRRAIAQFKRERGLN